MTYAQQKELEMLRLEACINAAICEANLRQARRERDLINIALNQVSASPQG
jgi:hypothetical protein